MQTAQVITGAALVLFIGVGFVPALRPYAARIRAGVLAAYLVACAGFVVYLLGGR